MPKKKKHLQFYMDCMKTKELLRAGLCECSKNGDISIRLLELFRPTNENLVTLFKEGYIPEPHSHTYWSSEVKVNKYYNVFEREYKFNPLRQTIVLFMAAIAGEL